VIEFGSVWDDERFVGVVIFIDGRPVPLLFYDDDQANTYLLFQGRNDARVHKGIKHLVALPKEGLPPGYLLFAVYDGEGFIGVVVWGAHGILPQIFPNEALALAHAIADYESKVPNSDFKPRR
jgi:hypothetical protein